MKRAKRQADVLERVGDDGQHQRVRRQAQRNQAPDAVGGHDRVVDVFDLVAFKVPDPPAAGPDYVRPTANRTIGTGDLSGGENDKSAQKGQRPKYLTGAVGDAPGHHGGGGMPIGLGSSAELQRQHGRQHHPQQTADTPYGHLIADDMVNPPAPPFQTFLIDREDLADVGKFHFSTAYHAGDRADQRSHAPTLVARVVGEVHIRQPAGARGRREGGHRGPINLGLGDRSKLHQATQNIAPDSAVDHDQTEAPQVSQHEKDFHRHHSLDRVVDLPPEDQRNKS